MSRHDELLDLPGRALAEANARDLTETLCPHHHRWRHRRTPPGA